MENVLTCVIVSRLQREVEECLVVSVTSQGRVEPVVRRQGIVGTCLLLLVTEGRHLGQHAGQPGHVPPSDAVQHRDLTRFNLN